MESVTVAVVSGNGDTDEVGGGETNDVAMCQRAGLCEIPCEAATALARQRTRNSVRTGCGTGAATHAKLSANRLRHWRGNARETQCKPAAV